jgi:hypothetical protein
LLGRNKIWTTVKNYPSPAFYIYLPAIILYDVLSLPYTVLVRGNRASLQGRIDGLKTLGRALRKRREIHGRRRSGSAELSSKMEPLTNPFILLRRYRHLDRLVRPKEPGSSGQAIA